MYVHFETAIVQKLVKKQNGPQIVLKQLQKIEKQKNNLDKLKTELKDYIWKKI